MERLNCYDAATDFKPTERPLTTADLLTASFKITPDAPKPKPKDGEPKPPPELKDQLSLRASPKIAKDNKDAASVSLASSGGRTAGSGSAAVLWVEVGGLAAVGQTQETAQTWYGGLGTKFDRTSADAAKHVSTQDYRFGHYAVLKARGDLESGISYSRDLSIVGKNDDKKGSHNFALEADFAWNRRWADYSKLDVLREDNRVSAGITPFLDRGVRGSTKGQSSRGLELRLGASTIEPKNWIRRVVGEGVTSTLTPKEFLWATEWVKSVGDVDKFSTLHKVSVSWSLTDPDLKKNAQGIKLSRSVGAQHRDGVVPENKSTLSFEWKYN